MTDEYRAEPGALPCYVLPGDALEYGASFGNAHCWVTTRGTGSIQALSLIASAFVGPGDGVIVEASTFPYPVQFLRATGATVTTVPRAPRRLASTDAALASPGRRKAELRVPGRRHPAHPLSPPNLRRA